jgi:molybdate transport system substrate-binding protein
MRPISVLLLFLSSFAPLASTEDLTIAAASDLNYVLNDLAARFEKKTRDKITFSFGSSGNLYSQIQSGAPYDLFFSADMSYPERLSASGLAEASSLRTYAVGRLVLWVPNKSRLDPRNLRMDLLLDPSVRRIAIANPQHAPYGAAAIAALEHFGLKDKVSGKLVFGENISQAAQFVQSGNAQAGFIALSLARSPAMKDEGRFWELPLDSYPELQQGVVVLSASKQKPAATAFLNYVLSAAGAEVLKQYGFLVPPDK